MDKKKELNSIKLNGFYIVIALLFFVVIIARVSQLSLSSKVDGINLQDFASSRTTKKDILLAKRGTIFDVKGDALAENVSSYTLIAYLSPSRTTNASNPKHVVDKKYTAEKLATVLDISYDKILEYLSKEGLYQTEFGSKGRGLTELTKDKIKALDLPGIDFVATQKRYYPYGDFLSYTIGYAKSVNDANDDGSSQESIVGEMGIEKYCNVELTGTNGYNLYQKDRDGYKIAGTKERTVEAKDGNDVYLTIDSTIQLFVEQAMDDAKNKYGYEWMTALVMDAKTGAILASATDPSFDPNVKDIDNYYNFNISNPYEPGSTMKIYSYMAAMENNVYDGNETYYSGVFKAKDGTEIGDWNNKKGWGTISYDQGFALSSNVAVSNLISKHMNASMLKDYYNKLGFGEKTGIELPGEDSGKVSFKYETEILNAGFGQGILTTPIQNVKALSAIANNGILLKPYIIDRIVDSDTNEVLYQGKREELDRVASEATVTKIKELMANVINGTSSTSTGYYYNMPGYNLIAKTGTAQVANSNGIGYSSSETIKGIAGMFPGNDPQVIIYIAAKNPGGDGSGLMKLVTQSIIKNVSKYLNIYDETAVNTKKLRTYDIKSFINKNKDEVVSSLQSAGINTIVLGDGNKIIKQFPNEGVTVNELEKVFLITNSNNITMPNIVGYSSRDASNLMRFLNIKYEVTGNGYVKSQSISPGTLINVDTMVTINCSL